MSDPMEAVRRLLDLRHRGRPEDLPPALAEVAPLLGAASVAVLLIDYEQITLWPLTGSDPGTAESLKVDGSLAGRAFTRAQLVHRENDEGIQLWLPLLLGAASVAVLLIDYEQITLWPLTGSDPGTAESLKVDGSLAGRAFTRAQLVHRENDEGIQLWLPLLHGAERLGVLEVRAKREPDAQQRRDLQVIAALCAELIASRQFYGDAVERTRRRLPMQLAAEIIWNQLPPLTFAANETVVTAVLEPCYDVGGDAFDYAANGDILHIALFDTVGHGISASALTTLTLNTYRNARRSGLSLEHTYRSIDKWIRAQYNGAFVTALMAELDTRTGEYRRISAGHPAELLLRDGHSLPALPTPTALPLGLGHMVHRGPGIAEAQLEPGDNLVFYTDGITEARDTAGQLFGLDALTFFMLDSLGADTPPAETMRGLIHNIVSYENGELRDDATAALLQWKPPHLSRS